VFEYDFEGLAFKQGILDRLINYTPATLGSIDQDNFTVKADYRETADVPVDNVQYRF